MTQNIRQEAVSSLPFLHGQCSRKSAPPSSPVRWSCLHSAHIDAAYPKYDRKYSYNRPPGTIGAGDDAYRQRRQRQHHFRAEPLGEQQDESRAEQHLPANFNTMPNTCHTICKNE